MKKFLNSKYGEAIVLTAASFLNILFILICYSLPLITSNDVGSLWAADIIETGAITESGAGFRIHGLNTYFIWAFVVELVLFAASAVLAFWKQKKFLFYASAVFNFVLGLAFVFVGGFLGILSAGAIVLAVFSLLLSIATIVFLVVQKRRNAAEEEPDETHVNAKTLSICKTAMLVCEILTTVLMFAMLFFPLFAEHGEDFTNSYTLISTLKTATNPIYLYIAFVVMFLSCFLGLLKFATTVSFYKSDKVFAQKSRTYMQGATMYALVFFVLGYCFSFVKNIANNADKAPAYGADTTAYIPFICSVAILIVFSVFYGKSGLGENIADNQLNETKLKIEPLIYVAILTVITFSTLFLNIIKIECLINEQVVSQVTLNGHQLLKTYKDLGEGIQIMSFALTAMLIASGVMLIVAVVSLLSKNKDYYKVTKTAAISNLVFVALLGLFEFYFRIAQKINEENILSLLQHFGISFVPNYEYNISGFAVYLFVASLLIVIVMIVRKQFNLTVAETLDVNVKSAPQKENAQHPTTGNVVKPPFEEPLEQVEDQTTFDACPAFTELDGMQEQFAAQTAEKYQFLFENLTLPNLVRFVVDYARECRLHLSYSLEDMATFVAGLGASRLGILQGMSGTGKTSLPKIFAEAIWGNCEIVEVESSWRDKNELLGYYNEFSKCYTPKKFTQCLYKAKLNPDVLTFIVLDEMNLSRIEYYFSDFLSLMENEEDKREIKLLNIKLHRLENGQRVPYCALTNGHTLKVPANVWFIGTANRDESTFAISDKVYDRAQTMNFNKRAPKIHSFGEPLQQRFAPYEAVNQLFDQAKAKGVFEAEDSAVVRQVEALLAPYNISFGNRILKQMEDFVKIYCACFGDKAAAEKDAVEKILLSKVVSKLENKVVEEKETLAAEFDKIGLHACGDFVRKLNED